MDIRKVFDTINHSLLVGKLSSQFGFSNLSATLIDSYLRGRSQIMKVGSYRSPIAYINKGVPQGSMLSPLLFNLMVDDMLINHPQTYSYSDDTLTYSFSKSQSEALDRVKQQFLSLNNWYQENGLSRCIAKTKCLIISNSDIDFETAFTVDGYNIPIQRSIVQFGMTIDYRLSFADHVNQVVKNVVACYTHCVRYATFVNYN